MRTVILIFLFSINTVYGQVDQDYSKTITNKVIALIESNNLESAAEFFIEKPKSILPILGDIKREIDSINNKASSKVIPVNSKNFYMYQWIKFNHDGAILLKVDFYFNKKDKERVISKILVRKKSSFSNKNVRRDMKRRPVVFPPPPSDNFD